jgi:hypothetical protein
MDYRCTAHSIRSYRPPVAGSLTLFVLDPPSGFVIAG